MTDGQKRRIENRILMLSAGIMVLLVAFLIYVGVTKQVETILFPLGISVGLLLYWIVSDVLSVIWLKEFEGKTEEQKKSYYMYALFDAVGFAGLAYFIIDMDSMIGALIYIACLFTKKRFREDFKGTANEEETETEENSEMTEESVQAVTAEAPDAIAETQTEALETQESAAQVQAEDLKESEQDSEGTEV